jgi:hypothetical protein
MVLFLALYYDKPLYQAEFLLDMSIDQAKKLESDIVTHMMKLDDTIVDGMLYSKKEFNKDNLPKSLQDIPVWHTSFADATLPTSTVERVDVKPVVKSVSLWED